jgi:GAF domain-containing protein
MADEAYRQGNPERRALVDLAGARSGVTVALRTDDALHGVFTIFRQEVRPFSDKEIGLLQNFAAQAVIAMENARLLTETREALEQQTATAEVLQVINSSPGNLAPIFDAILEKALRVCSATFGTMASFDNGSFTRVAARGLPAAYDKWRLEHPFPDPVGYPPPLQQLLAGEAVVQEPDLMAGEAYRLGNPERRALVDLGGARSSVRVALRNDDALHGAIMIFRQEVRPFSDKEIRLLQNFAAQAVIAMENARLLTETREALEQQTATAEVLQVINSSPGELGPVFDAILEKAMTLCNAAFGVLWTYDGVNEQAAAIRGAPAPYASFLTGASHPPGHLIAQFERGEPFVHGDAVDSQAYRDGEPLIRALVELAGGRTRLGVPLCKDAAIIGLIVLYRQEVRPFADKQIALLQNFAAQAVIAMENARLLDELRQRTDDLSESLEQQTATSEVLKVISSSPGDLAPVFQTMLENAVRLCKAGFGVFWIAEGNGFRSVALHAVPSALAEARHMKPFIESFDPNSAVGVRRDKAAFSSGCKTHPATAPAGSNRSSYGGDEIAEAFGMRVTNW